MLRRKNESYETPTKVQKKSQILKSILTSKKKIAERSRRLTQSANRSDHLDIKSYEPRDHSLGNIKLRVRKKAPSTEIDYLLTAFYKDRYEKLTKKRELYHSMMESRDRDRREMKEKKDKCFRKLERIYSGSVDNGEPIWSKSFKEKLASIDVGEKYVESFLEAGDLIYLQNRVLVDVKLPEKSYIKARIKKSGFKFPMRVFIEKENPEMEVNISYDSIPTRVAYDQKKFKNDFYIFGPEDKDQRKYVKFVGIMIISYKKMHTRFGCVFNYEKKNKKRVLDKKKNVMAKNSRRSFDFSKLVDFPTIDKRVPLSVFEFPGNQRILLEILKRRGRKRDIVRKNRRAVKDPEYVSNKSKKFYLKFNKEMNRIVKAKEKKESLLRDRIIEIRTRKSRNQICKEKREALVVSLMELLVTKSRQTAYVRLVEVVKMFVLIRKRFLYVKRVKKEMKNRRIWFNIRVFCRRLLKYKKSNEIGMFEKTKISGLILAFQTRDRCNEKARKWLGLFFKSTCKVLKTNFFCVNMMLDLRAIKNRFKSHLRLRDKSFYSFLQIFEFSLNQLEAMNDTIKQYDPDLDITANYDELGGKAKRNIFHVVFNESMFRYLWLKIKKTKENMKKLQEQKQLNAIGESFFRKSVKVDSASLIMAMKNKAKKKSVKPKLKLSNSMNTSTRILQSEEEDIPEYIKLELARRLQNAFAMGRKQREVTRKRSMNQRERMAKKTESKKFDLERLRRFKKSRRKLGDEVSRKAYKHALKLQKLGVLEQLEKMNRMKKVQSPGKNKRGSKLQFKFLTMEDIIENDQSRRGSVLSNGIMFSNTFTDSGPLTPTHSFRSKGSSFINKVKVLDKFHFYMDHDLAKCLILSYLKETARRKKVKEILKKN